MSLRIMTREDYLRAMNEHFNNNKTELTRRIVKHRNMMTPVITKDIVEQYEFDDGTVIELYYAPMPSHQVIWGEWQEFAITVVTVPTDNPIGLKTGEILRKKALT